MPKTAIHTPKASDFRVPTSLAIRSGNLLSISGTAAHDRDGKTVGVENAEAQTRQALDNLKALVEAAGGTLTEVTGLAGADCLVEIEAIAVLAA